MKHDEETVTDQLYKELRTLPGDTSIIFNTHTRRLVR